MLNFKNVFGSRIQMDELVFSMSIKSSTEHYLARLKVVSLLETGNTIWETKYPIRKPSMREFPISGDFGLEILKNGESYKL